jgi:Pyruvate/2-oxoacid:ferredoxin oxidoreductase delta subunit
MQLTERIPDCNGCGACAVVCKEHCIKLLKNDQGLMRPVVDEDGCRKCNNCVLYCPLYNPVELPAFSNYYEYDDDFYYRNMPQVYRETMRASKAGGSVDFAGTLCQIAGLKSLQGDKIRPTERIMPLHCDPDAPRRPECTVCRFVQR